MPVWHETTKAMREDGRLNVVTIVPEQHGERTLLFMQWKKLDWPTLVDPLNALRLPYVPIALAVDEHGIVRLVQPLFGPVSALEEFLGTEYDAPGGDGEAPTHAALTRDALPEQEGPARDAMLRMMRGATLFMSGREGALDAAIAAYRKATEKTPADAMAWFRLGVALRARYDSGHGKPGDFQEAVEAWSRSLRLDPNDYIVRRRLQQYGPRLDKPYPFYEWVTTAREEIAARGETPRPLAVEPAGSETAGRAAASAAASGDGKDPDPERRIKADDARLIAIEPVVVPAPVAPGAALRIHLVFRPDASKDAHWNNEVGPLFVRVTPPDGWSIGSRTHEVPPVDGATSTETRRVEFDLSVPEGAAGPARLGGYALYYVCEGATGQCLFRRQEIDVPIAVGKHAASAES